jgi:hypothetical protein
VEFQKLGQVEEANFDAGTTNLRGPCTPETREQILSELMEWALDDTKPTVYWLSGMAGTGKTTISYSFCERLRKAGLLSASFFCTRTIDATRDPKAIIPTTSYSLASYSQAASDALLSALQNPDNNGIRKKDVKRQFKVLIPGTVKALYPSSVSKRHVIVYDGFDEAENESEIGEIVASFLEHASTLPIKVFISSRRDEKIRDQFDNANNSIRSTLILHDIEKDLVKEDIRRYMTARLDNISNRLKVKRDIWISDEELSLFVEHAGTLFVYASALCSYLNRTVPEEAADRVQSLLSKSANPIDGSKEKPTVILDNLYAEILKKAYSGDSKDIKPLLQLVVAARYPLDISGIADLLGVKRYRITNALSFLNSVLTVPAGYSDSQPIAIFHASFRDFLVEKSRSGDAYLKPTDCHNFLADCCWKVLEKKLTKNDICGVKNKGLNRSEISESIIKQSITSSLEYACINWWTHLLEVSKEQVETHTKQIIRFFDHFVLRWAECMAWIGKLEEGLKLLRRIEISQQVSQI